MYWREVKLLPVIRYHYHVYFEDYVYRLDAYI